MRDEDRTKPQLIADLAQLRQRIADLEVQEAQYSRQFRAEVAQRQQLQNALQATEKKLNTLLESTSVAIFIANRQGRIEMANIGAQRIFGYTKSELIGQPIEMLLPERFRAAHTEYRERYLHNPRTRAMGVGLDLWGRCKNGNEFPLEVGLSHVKIEEEEYVISFVIDITKRKKAEEALAQRAEELARSNAELEQFAYVASHDLKEPLRMVTSYVTLLERRYKGRLDHKADKFIHYAVDGATRMQALINDLLKFFRVDTQHQPFQIVDCERLVNQVLDNLTLAIEENKATVTYNSLPKVVAEPVQLGQVFQNLIDNAIRFRSELPPQVQITAKQTEKTWQFSVRDNGLGIEPKYSDRIFVVFKRLHTRANYPGNGIGLALCKKIVERHGGQIWVESQAGQGSTFCFTIPLPAEAPLAGSQAIKQHRYLSEQEETIGEDHSKAI